MLVLSVLLPIAVMLCLVDWWWWYYLSQSYSRVTKAWLFMVFSFVPEFDELSVDWSLVIWLLPISDSFGKLVLTSAIKRQVCSMWFLKVKQVQTTTTHSIHYFIAWSPLFVCRESWMMSDEDKVWSSSYYRFCQTQEIIAIWINSIQFTAI